MSKGEVGFPEGIVAGKASLAAPFVTAHMSFVTSPKASGHRCPFLSAHRPCACFRRSRLKPTVVLTGHQ